VLPFPRGKANTRSLIEARFLAAGNGPGGRIDPSQERHGASLTMRDPSPVP
jgi:hypothetical protein